LKFSSHVRYVPHGVAPFAQLFTVPSTATPCGSADVCSSGCPAAGPVISIGVFTVIRRALRLRTTDHWPCRSSISHTATPWAFCDRSTVSAAAQSGSASNMIVLSTASWFTTSKPRLADSGK
jgi:hypothetical protein